jgi:hypothetical protein
MLHLEEGGDESIVLEDEIQHLKDENLVQIGENEVKVIIKKKKKTEEIKEKNVINKIEKDKESKKINEDNSEVDNTENNKL